jgi:hypothetical protein
MAEAAPRQEGNQMHTILTGRPSKGGRPSGSPAPDALRRPAPTTTTAAAPVGARPLAGQAAAPPASSDES